MTEAQLFGTNGIRGRINRELTPKTIMKIGCAIGTFFNQGTLVVGCDARTSSQMMVNAIMAGITATGCHVVFVGMNPTPTIQFFVRHGKNDGGVIITASHNPPQYNGVKVVDRDGVGFRPCVKETRSTKGPVTNP